MLYKRFGMEITITMDNQKVINRPAGFLATYIAAYEPNMGVEYAQFPSKEYTDTYRTNVLFYGISRDGMHMLHR